MHKALSIKNIFWPLTIKNRLKEGCNKSKYERHKNILKEDCNKSIWEETNLSPNNVLIFWPIKTYWRRGQYIQTKEVFMWDNPNNKSFEMNPKRECISVSGEIRHKWYKIRPPYLYNLIKFGRTFLSNKNWEFNQNQLKHPLGRFSYSAFFYF